MLVCVVASLFMYNRAKESMKSTAVVSVSGVVRSLVLAGHLLYASSMESNNTSARARFARDRVR